MTRINNVLVSELSDQHCFTEWRELPRIISNVRKAINKGKSVTDFKIPPQFTLGKGHMTFFYDKLDYLVKRHKQLTDECIKRGYKLSSYDELDISDIGDEWKGDYFPTTADITVLRERLSEKFDANPDFYKYYGKDMKNPYNQEK